MVTPSRIALARRRRGLTHVELSELVGVSAQSLSNYENGRQAPYEEVVERLAMALNFPTAFFYAKEADPITPQAVSFRARSKPSFATRRTSGFGGFRASTGRWWERAKSISGA